MLFLFREFLAAARLGYYIEIGCDYCWRNSFIFIDWETI